MPPFASDRGLPQTSSSMRISTPARPTTTDRSSYYPAEPQDRARSMMACQPWTGWIRAGARHPRSRRRNHRVLERQGRLNIIDTPARRFRRSRSSASRCACSTAPCACARQHQGVGAADRDVAPGRTNTKVPRIVFANNGQDRRGFLSVSSDIFDRLGAKARSPSSADRAENHFTEASSPCPA